MAKKTILVVDDEPPIVQVVGDLLKQQGYKVMEATSGKETLEILKKSKPDLILLDIMMPGMDGWDVVEKIKSNKNLEKIPIVFLTAKIDPISRSMGSLASTDYITKPFDNKDLIRRVKNIIG